MLKRLLLIAAVLLSFACAWADGFPEAPPPPSPECDSTDCDNSSGDGHPGVNLNP